MVLGVLAAVNVFGGFLVTRRRLEMLRKEKRANVTTGAGA
jgi:NAD/NADP transhydrogenase alpha subunit